MMTQTTQKKISIVRKVLPFMILDLNWICLGSTIHQQKMWSLDVFFNNQMARFIHYGSNPPKVERKGIYNILVKIKGQYEGLRQFQIDYNSGESYPIFIELIRPV